MAGVVTRSDPPRWWRTSWPAAVAMAAVAIAVAFAPAATALIVVGLSTATFLVWRFGALYGLWYLVLITLPIKEPLSFDVSGTVSFYPVDAVLMILFVVVVLKEGTRRLWRESPTLRVLLAILVVSLPGLYGATQLFWGVATIYRLVMQLAVFVVARSLVRTTADARRALVAVVLSLAAPVAYGFYQAAVPYGAPVADWGYLTTAYDSAGHPFLRIFSTMDHPLNFSQYLTTGFALALGMASRLGRTRTTALLVVVAVATALCNFLTYSAGGVLGMFVAVIAVVVLTRSRRLAVAAVVLILAALLLAPPALVSKVQNLSAGQAVTAAARLVTYKQSFMLLRDHPVLGVGWGGIWGALHGEYRMTRAQPVAFGAENYFLQRAIALGLVGLALYVWVLAMYTRRLAGLRGFEPESRGLGPLGAGMLVATLAFFTQAEVIPAANVSTNSVLWLFFAVAESLTARHAASGGAPRDAAGGSGVPGA
jgi:O-antigen ligase